jgi:hypothetical protein
MLSPYDDAIEDLAREKGWSEAEARDRFIWTALHLGDVAPLCFFLLHGHVPAAYVRQLLALMLTPELAEGPTDFREVAERLKFQDVQFRFEIKSRRRGPKSNNFNVAWRNWHMPRTLRS